VGIAQEHRVGDAMHERRAAPPMAMPTAVARETVVRHASPPDPTGCGVDLDPAQNVVGEANAFLTEHTASPGRPPFGRVIVPPAERTWRSFAIASGRNDFPGQRACWRHTPPLIF